MRGLGRILRILTALIAILAIWPASASAANAISVPSPGQSSTLDSVTAVTARDAWAVGTYCEAKCRSSALIERYMILHWDGAKWSLKVRGPAGFLQGVSAASATDAWAVG